MFKITTMRRSVDGAEESSDTGGPTSAPEALVANVVATQLLVALDTLKPGETFTVTVECRRRPARRPGGAR